MEAKKRSRGENGHTPNRRAVAGNPGLWLDSKALFKRLGVRVRCDRVAAKRILHGRAVVDHVAGPAYPPKNRNYY